jgi:hypothetical protein
MNYNDLNHQYINAMQQAETCANRAEAVDLIHRATKLRSAMDVIKMHEFSEQAARCAANGYQ